MPEPKKAPQLIEQRMAVWMQLTDRMKKLECDVYKLKQWKEQMENNRSEECD